jgi:HK97 family phage prohead protease
MVMADAERFNKFHAKAGSSTGGQFASSSSGGGSAAKAPAAHAAAPAAPAGHGTGGHGTGTRQQLLEQAHADLKEAATLETQLHTLEKQHHAAVAAAKHSAAQAAASKKAGHTIQHGGHTTAHKHHTHHAKTISQRITSLQGRIHDLRQHAHELEKKAAAMRAAGMITNPAGTERLHQYWVHGEGAAKIQWEAHGSFDRCVAELGKYIKDPKGYCNLAHHAATGRWYNTGGNSTGRSQVTDKTPDAAPMPFVRSFPLQDISIRAGGDGRTVDAYATVFDTPAPIHDKDGDYIEVIDRRAFDRILPKLAPSGNRSGWRLGVFYNHGMTIHGTPSDRHSMPIGVPLEVKADDHGLFTRTRYHKGELADQVLEAIREGSLSGYSFSGAFHRSTPLVPRGGFRPDRTGNLPTVRRTESTLREYGPTPFPAYADADIIGVRSEQIMAQLDHITELLRSGAPLGDSPDFSAAPPDEGSAAEDSHAVRSGRPVKQLIQANRSDFLQRQHRR